MLISQLLRGRKKAAGAAFSLELRAKPRAIVRRMTVDSVTDEELIERILAGDMRAFEMLVNRYQGYVMAVIRRHVPHELAEDVAQGAFLEVYRSLASFRGESSFKSWMTRIVLRQCYGYWRTQGKKASIPFSTLQRDDSEWLDAVFAGQANEKFSQEQNRLHARKLLEMALARLNEEDRFLVVAVFLEERSQEEVAAVLNWSGPRLRVRIHRAKKRMAKAVEEILNS